jgi:hypothetical protein
MTTTAISRNPSNPNLLQVNKYLLTFARCPNIQYFCQSVTVPGISKVEILRNTPFVDTYIPGEKAIYDLLNVTFLIDEELKSWLEIHDWIRALTFPKDFQEYLDLSKISNIAGAIPSVKPQYTDGSLMLLSSNNTPYYKFKFYGMFPTSISSFIMNSSEGPETILTADATFRYTYFDVEKLF